MAIAALVAGGAVVCAAPAAAAPVAVRITPNPAYASEPFEGWGTSLAWFANATGGYPDELRQELVEKLFGDQGLNLNVARYNIGGGNASDVVNYTTNPEYMRLGGAVPGWWNPNLGVSDANGPVTSNLADRDRYAAAWDPDNPDHFDFDADANQRWWIDAVKDDVTHWEAFSNSPPYFLTNSGYVTGGFSATSEQLDSADLDAFAGYLVGVSEHIEASHGISFDSIEPFNEPKSGYWWTWFKDGKPDGKEQEGAYVSAGRQSAMVGALADRLARPDVTTNAVIAAMDETNPTKFVDNWKYYTPTARDAVDRLNVHTYGHEKRVEVRDIAKGAGKPLWMSEFESPSYGSGFTLVNIEAGLSFAGSVVADLRELEPSAWVMWQPIEDTFWRQQNSTNWGSVYIDFDCNADGDSLRRIAANQADPSCKVQTNAKYNTMRNFTHYIDEGDRLIAVDNTQTTAAIDTAASTLSLVHVNNSTSAREVTVDLSHFSDVGPDATVTPIVTTQSTAQNTTLNALKPGTPVAVDAATKTARVVLPAKSVSTLVVADISGVAATSPALRDGMSYQLAGVESGKLLTADAAIASVRAADSTAATPGAQTWTVHTLSGEGTNRHRFALRSGDGRLLSATGSAIGTSQAALSAAATDPALQWIANTSDGKTFSLLNVASGGTVGFLSAATVGEGAALQSTVAGRAGHVHQQWTLTAAEPAAPLVNLALTSTAASTYAEPSYGAGRTINGSTTDKGWSNWRGTTKNPVDTLTYTLAATSTVESARLYFFKDGATTSWPQSVTVEYRNTAGAWVALPAVSVTDPADGTAPVVEIPLGGVTATAVRTVLTAKPGTYMVASEVQIFGSTTTG